MIGIDLFAGAGGLSLGAVQAGIDVRFAVEADPHAAMTYAFNHQNTIVHSEDIRNLEEIKIDVQGQATILFGGPPCQGFSTFNQKTRNLDNPMNWLFKEFLRIVTLWRPDWVVFENVTGIKETEGGIFLQRVIDEIQARGYITSSWILNAADFGVPQQRSRLFGIGSLHGIRIAPPKPTVSKYVTVRKAIADLPELPNGASIHSLSLREILSHECKQNKTQSTQGKLKILN